MHDDSGGGSTSMNNNSSRGFDGSGITGAIASVASKVAGGICSVCQGSNIGGVGASIDMACDVDIDCGIVPDSSIGVISVRTIDMDNMSGSRVTQGHIFKVSK